MSRTQKKGVPTYHGIEAEPRWHRKDRLRGFQGVPPVGSDSELWGKIALRSKRYREAWDQQVRHLINALVSQDPDGNPEITPVAARGLWEMGHEKGDPVALEIGLAALRHEGDEGYAIGDRLEPVGSHDYSSC